MFTPPDPFCSFIRTSPSDHAKRSAVLCALSACDMLVFDRVTVSIDNEVFMLEGIVPDFGDNERAVTIAEAVVGSGNVRNRLLCGR